jgi:spermidine synthase
VRDDQKQQQNHKPFIIFLLVTAVLCGALIMVVEVMGSRVIGPFFGVSLFVWTSLITVTLLTLAVGYAIGGVISDRYEQASYLFGIILLAGVLTLLVPLMKAPVLKLCMPLGLRSGAFASTLILFGPILLLLGCVSPYLVKLAAREMHNIGRVVGGLYALSTIGSTVGTLLAGFVLIAYLGVDLIFVVIGGLLVALAVVYFLVFERRWWTLVFLVLPVLLHQPAEAVSRTMEDGTQVDLVHSEENYYGSIKVVDYSHGDMSHREMIIDGMIQGGLDLNNRLPVYEYNYFMQFLSYMLAPQGKSCLVIGLGLGVIPEWYAKQGINCDVNDINPAVVEVAKEYFGFRPTGDVIIQDARYFLNTTERRYDFIVLDVFSGDITPHHLLSREALELIRHRLTSQGVLAINLIGSIQRETYMTASVIKTLEAVFDQVNIFPTFNPQRSQEGIGNLAVMAYQGPPRQMRAEHHRFVTHPRVARQVYANLGRRFHFPDNTPAMVLTDDYNPIDFYDGWLREKVRKTIINSTNWDILIY